MLTPIANAETGLSVRGKLNDLMEIVQSRVISAKEFGALGDDSGTTVDQWLTGGTYSRGAANLTELRTMTGIANLELTDTIDWAAITEAANFAVERPVYLPSGTYRITRALTFTVGGLEGELTASGSPAFRTRIAKKAGSAISDVVVLAPTANNKRFHFRNLVISGGQRGLYASNVAAGGIAGIEQHSVFENIYCSAAVAEGFFFEDLEAIMGRFVRLKAESCGSHGIRFKGRSILNGAQIEGGRSAANAGHGWFFENTHDTAPVPGVVIDGVIAEFNSGAGINITGYYAALYSPYFEQNDIDAGGQPDLQLASTNTTPSRVHTQCVAIQPYFATTNHPSNIVIGGSINGPQQLTVIQPIMPSEGVIDTTHLEVLILGGKPNTFVTSGTRRLAALAHPGLNLAGARSVTTTPTSLMVPSETTGAMMVLGSHSDGTASMYLVRRNTSTTVTATFIAGSATLTFSVVSGFVCAATATGTATVSVHGH